jgi:hypothetical protein
MFKYITGGINGLSNGWGNIYVLKNNFPAQDTIGRAYFSFDSTTTWTPFQSEIQYSLPGNPDSVYIEFWNSTDNCVQNMTCNLLYLDDLHLTDSPLHIEKPAFSFFSIFPNPSNEDLNVRMSEDELFSAELLDFKGKTILFQKGNGLIHFQTRELPAGIYFLKITGPSGQTGMKKWAKN